MVNVICTCGNSKIVSLSGLRSGKTRSCGCYRLERIKNKNKTHGYSSTRFYNIFQGIKTRCENTNSAPFKEYGGRGILCEWMSFEDFKTDMYDSYNEHLTIDRIDVNGNYSKKNCRWVTKEDQNRNKRNTVWYEGKCITQYCKNNHISLPMVLARINKMGWSIKDAVEIKKKGIMYKGKTLKDYCKDNDISYSTVMGRVRKGVDLQDAIKKEPIIPRIMYKGVFLKDFCTVNNISYKRVHSKYKRGLSLEEAICVLSK